MKNLLRTAALALVGLLAALGLTGCSSGNNYDQLCVDPVSQMRMDWTYCTVGNPYYHSGWVYFVPYGYSAPGIHQHITNYNTNNFNRPKKGKVHTDPVPNSGGKVQSPSKPKSTNKPNTNKTGGTYKAPKSNNKAPSYRRK